MINWPDSLIESIAKRACVLYLGSGISANSVAKDGVTHPPTWKNFLETVLSKVDKDTRYIEELIDKENFLLACDILVRRLGKHVFQNIAQNSFQSPGFSGAKIHDLLYNLDSNIVVTPNVDNIYERYAQSMSEGTVIVKKYDEPDISNAIRNHNKVIIKAHGSIESPNGMIFSKRQYSEARYNNANFYSLLDALMITHTYIFLGCGMNDPDIQLVLENYHFRFYQSNQPHYFVLPNEEVNNDVKEIFLENYNLQVLSYDNSDTLHTDLLKSLKQLVSDVESRRDELAKTQAW